MGLAAYALREFADMRRVPMEARRLANKGLGVGCPVCAHFVHYTSRRNRVPPRRGFRVEVQ